ncbi:hypothetical protein NQ318_003488 [Aromia moschata]|uniref:Uncharacterized protein n=1 Tax=Aromia moschata TaxID=1265417 RepID=A0AAV8YUD9_9CUCU|nr:hypothetical protein NQ318_003488 [Aromia moschata]
MLIGNFTVRKFYKSENSTHFEERGIKNTIFFIKKIVLKPVSILKGTMKFGKKNKKSLGNF